MSIYAELLQKAVEARPEPLSDATPDELLARLVERRRRLSQPLNAHGGRVHAALADQLLYDIALMDLCRRLEIECDPQAFGQAEVERDRLDRALAANGVSVPWAARSDVDQNA